MLTFTADHSYQNTVRDLDRSEGAQQNIGGGRRDLIIICQPTLSSVLSVSEINKRSGTNGHFVRIIKTGAK